MEQTPWAAPLGMKDRWYSPREPVTPPDHAHAAHMEPFPGPLRPTTPVNGQPTQPHRPMATPVSGPTLSFSSVPGPNATPLSPSGPQPLTPLPLTMTSRTHSRSYSYSPQSASAPSRQLLKLSLDTTPRPRAYSSGLYDLVEWGPIGTAQRPTPSKGGYATGMVSPPAKNPWPSPGADRRRLSDADLGSPPQILALCKDQRGCRFLQRRLSEGDPAVVERIFDSTLSHMSQLMVDPFANYFCQRLVERCTDYQISAIVRQVAPDLVSIALNPHGTRAFQRLIERLTTDEQVELVRRALDGSVVRLIRDLNGNHVVQKLLLSLDASGAQFIYTAVCEAIVEIGGHRHGCCVLQRCLDYAQPTNKHRLVCRVIEQSNALVGDPYGNYVCQYVLDLREPEYTSALIKSFSGSIKALSLQKFSSNVVEKCLKLAGDEQISAIVYELLDPSTLHSLLLDNYGNYVIQTALENTRGDSHKSLADAVSKALATIRSPYGRCIMAKLR